MLTVQENTPAVKRGTCWLSLVLLWVLMAHPLIHSWESADHHHGTEATSPECPACAPSSLEMPVVRLPVIGWRECPYLVVQPQPPKHTVPPSWRGRSPPSA